MRQVTRSLAALVVVGGCQAVEAPPDDEHEPCTPSTTGAVAVDENGNGILDEGCDWNLGTPQAVAPRQGAPWELWSQEPNWISGDGLRLYAVVQGAGMPYRAEILARTGVDQPFSAIADVVGVDLGNYLIGGVTLSQDELELIVAARPVAESGDKDLYRATRRSISEPFNALEKLSILSGTGDDQRPFLRADGLELLYTGNGRLRHTTRSRPGDAFGKPVDLAGVPTVDVNAPSLTADGHTLFFTHRVGDRNFRVWRAFRVELDGGFDQAVELTALEPSNQFALVHPLISSTTRELFYGSAQPWGPIKSSLWRAEVCRDGACRDRIVPCAGVRSPDNLHCYTRLQERQSQAQAEAACKTLGGHLASIQSQGEQDLIWTALGGEALWVGGFDDRAPVSECNARGLDGSAAWPCAWGWEDGSRWTFAAWAGTPELPEPGETGEEDCVDLSPDFAGRWVDTACAGAHRAVCETELAATW